jgi:hypothetical protein
MSEQPIPTDLIELQRARDAAYEAIALRAGHLTDEEHARLWAQARDAVEALHAHPAMTAGRDRAELVNRLRLAATPAA